MISSMISREKFDKIKEGIDLSKYPSKNCFSNRNAWVINQYNVEAINAKLTYGKYIENLYLGKIRRPKESQIAEVLIFEPEEKSQIHQISMIEEAYS